MDMTTATLSKVKNTCEDLIDKKYDERFHQFNNAYELMSSETPEIYTQYKDYKDFWDYLNQNIVLSAICSGLSQYGANARIGASLAEHEGKIWRG
jgi:hypothetical protein